MPIPASPAANPPSPARRPLPRCAVVRFTRENGALTMQPHTSINNSALAATITSPTTSNGARAPFALQENSFRDLAALCKPTDSPCSAEALPRPRERRKSEGRHPLQSRRPAEAPRQLDSIQHKQCHAISQRHQSRPPSASSSISSEDSSFDQAREASSSSYYNADNFEPEPESMFELYIGPSSHTVQPNGATTIRQAHREADLELFNSSPDPFSPLPSLEKPFTPTEEDPRVSLVTPPPSPNSAALPSHSLFGNDSPGWTRSAAVLRVLRGGPRGSTATAPDVQDKEHAQGAQSQTFGRATSKDDRHLLGGANRTRSVGKTVSRFLGKWAQRTRTTNRHGRGMHSSAPGGRANVSGRGREGNGKELFSREQVQKRLQVTTEVTDTYFAFACGSRNSTIL